MRHLQRIIVLATFLFAGGAVAQRISVAPEAFLDDVGTVAGASRLGGALLALDATRKSWGDYCSESQGLARRGEFRQAIRVAAKALYLGETLHNNRGAPVIYSLNDIANAYAYAGDHASASAWATRTLDAIAKGYESQFHAAILLIRSNAHRVRALAMSHAGNHDAA